MKKYIGLLIAGLITVITGLITGFILDLGWKKISSVIIDILSIVGNFIWSPWTLVFILFILFIVYNKLYLIKQDESQDESPAFIEEDRNGLKWKYWYKQQILEKRCKLDNTIIKPDNWICPECKFNYGPDFYFDPNPDFYFDPNPPSIQNREFVKNNWKSEEDMIEIMRSKDFK